MSNADTTPLDLAADGVSVRKSYESDEFPVQVVSFEVRSEREDAARFRLVDPVPEAVAAADLGFNPNYGGDHWSAGDGTAVFERRIEPNETFRTVYGVRDTDIDPAAFMTEPTLTVDGADGSDSPAEDASTTETETGPAPETPGRDTSQAARDVISGEGSVSGLDNDRGGVEAVDLSGDGDSGTATETTTADSAGPAGDGAGAALPEGGVGAVLAAELRDGDLSEPDRKLLANELDGNDAGHEVRVSHLQSRISDLEAYTDALEDFIDENGPARKLIEDMTDRLETIEADVEALDERTTENATAIERLDDHTESNADDIDALDKGVADTNAEVAETQESVADLREDVEAIDDWREQISNVLGGVSTDRDED
ncbi:hypothetical protein [Halococcus salsus]|uniref:hypothetical protein n=1 Tax=Halococcus salsus TaxID=2162894 RepID=UPI001358AE98|nr:hypothetical protein [Halococcus salsus]